MMLKLFVFISLLAIISVVVGDYDFKDSEFNELIFDDLTDGAVDSLRVRRDAPASLENLKDRHHKKSKKEKDAHCCSGESGNPQELEAAKEVKHQCIAEIRGESGTDDDEPSYDPLSCEGVEVMREKTICAAECIVKKLDLLDGNGEFKRDALLNHTRKIVGESKWKTPVLEQFIDGCLGSLSKKVVTTTEKIVASDVTPIVSDEKSTLSVESKDEKLSLLTAEEKSHCNPGPLEFHHCMWKKFVEACPVDQQIDSKKCRKVRERLAKGDTSYAEKTFKKLFKRRH